MKGSKQCPQCECTDVPVNAEVCPFCGYEFVKPTVAEPKVKQKKPAVKLAEEKKPTEVKGISEGEKEGADLETGSQSIVTEGTAIPESTEYKTYQKKGIIKRTAAGTAPQEQGRKSGNRLAGGSAGCGSPVHDVPVPGQNDDSKHQDGLSGMVLHCRRSVIWFSACLLLCQ